MKVDGRKIAPKTRLQRYGKDCHRDWGKRGGNPHMRAMKGKHWGGLQNPL